MTQESSIGRTVLVAGGGSPGGIGRALAHRFGAAGDRVILVDCDQQGARQVAAELSAAGVRSAGYGVDVSESAAVTELIKRVESEHGDIDVLVNAVGIARPTPVWDIDDEEWTAIVGTNLTGAFLLIRASLPGMIRRGRGRIVAISSMTAKRGKGLVGGAHYAASKAGVLGLTRAVAAEVGRFGITCNAVCPGVIETGMTSRADADRLAAMLADTPLGRVGRPSEVAATVFFLCSEDAAFITGEDVDVNGGVYMD